LGKSGSKGVPKIRIRKVCEDTCPECYELKNKFLFIGRRNNNNDTNNNDGDANNNEDDDASSSSLSSNEDDESSSSTELANSDGGNVSDSYPYEELINNANQHAEEAKQQRALARQRQQTAMEEADQPHEHRRFVLLTVILHFF
jgi:hypothetical protein